MLIHIKIKMISRINQILVEIFLPNSHKYNAYSALYITTMNIILTIITLALLIFQVRSEATDPGLESAQMQFLMLRNPSHMSLSTSNPLWEAQKESEKVMITGMRMKKDR